MTNKPVVLIGNGGHAAVLTEILLKQKREIIGFTSPSMQENCFGIEYLGPDETIDKYSWKDIELVLALGTVNVSDKRSNIYNFFKKKEFNFSSVIHSDSIISPHATLGEGVQIMAGSVIQPFAKIADNTIINTSASIDHHTVVGNHCHIAPGVTICGNVQIGDGTLVGTGSTIIQNVVVGNRVLIGAGSVVINNLEDDGKFYGVPAKEV